MSLTKEEIDVFVDRKLEGMRDRPRMYGTDDALELAALILLELVKLSYANPEHGERWVTNLFQQEVHRRYKSGPRLLRDLGLPNFSQALYDICQVVLAELRKT